MLLEDLEDNFAASLWFSEVGDFLTVSKQLNFSLFSAVCIYVLQVYQPNGDFLK